jgi:FkbH-like protein
MSPRLAHTGNEPLQLEWAFLRVEDFMTSHPELNSTLASAGTAAKSVTHFARSAENQARRKMKKKSMRRAVSAASAAAEAESLTHMGRAEADFTPASVRSATLDEIVGDSLLGADIAQLLRSAPELIRSMVLTCVQDTQSYPAPAELTNLKRTYRRIQFLPMSPHLCPEIQCLLQNMEQAVQLSVQCLAGISVSSARPQTPTVRCTDRVTVHCRHDPTRLMLNSCLLQFTVSGLHTTSCCKDEGGGLPHEPQPLIAFKVSFVECGLDQSVSDDYTGTGHLLMAQDTTVFCSHEVLESLPESLGARQWFSQLDGLAAHCPYKPSLWAAVARRMIADTLKIVSIPQKIIVLDCDNTLWGGAVGELNAGGIKLTAKYLELQRFMQQRKGEGFLLAIASRNEMADVLSVFEKRSADMALQKSDFVAWQVNWGRKSNSLKAIAEMLNVGLNSFIFVDDNPVEVAEVNSQLGDGRSGVTCILLPENPSGWRSFLENCWVFGRMQQTQQITAIDVQRTNLYQQQLLRSAVCNKSRSLPAFLASLELKFTFDEDQVITAARISQLTDRTNQFNASKQVLCEQEVILKMEAQHCSVLAVTATDRFGCYGLIGVAIMEHATEAVPTGEKMVSALPNPNSVMAASTGVEQGTISAAVYGKHRARVVSCPPLHYKCCVFSHFLISCRILHRGVEHSLLRHAAAIAASRGADMLAIPWAPSDRNEPAARFLFHSLYEQSVFLPSKYSDGALSSFVPGNRQVHSSASISSHGSSQKTPVNTKPPPGIVYISVTSASSIQMSLGDSNIEEVFGEQSDDARQAAKIREQLSRESVLDSSPSPDPHKAARLSEENTVCRKHAIAVSEGGRFKLTGDTYCRFAQYNAGLEVKDFNHKFASTTSLHTLELSDEAVTHAAEEELAKARSQYLSAEAQQLLSGVGPLQTFKAKQILEAQSMYRRKMRLKAKVIQQDGLRKRERLE